MREKIKALSDNNGSFEARMEIKTYLQDDFLRWKLNIMTVVNFEFCFEIFSDFSNTGWGACCNGEKIYGFWNKRNREYHINYLESLAAFFGSKCFAKNCSNCKILLCIDNFSIIGRILNKIKSEGSRGILVFPYWPSQPFFPLCMSMLESEPLVFKPKSLI